MAKLKYHRQGPVSMWKTGSKARAGENFGGFDFTKDELKGLPVLSKILKQLTPKRVKREIELRQFRE